MEFNRQAKNRACTTVFSGCNRVIKKLTKTLPRNSSILTRKHRYLRDARERALLFRRRDVSRRRYRVRSRVESRFHSRVSHSTGVIVCSEFTQSRLQLLGFAFINGNVYGTIHIATQLGSRRGSFFKRERERETAGVSRWQSSEQFCHLFFLNPRGARTIFFPFLICSRINSDDLERISSCKISPENQIVTIEWTITVNWI